MCGRIVYVWDPITQQLVEKIVDPSDWTEDLRHVVEKKRYNVPPASHLPVISAGGMEVARWGFPIPQRPNGVFNTRVETAADSPMWRGLLDHRCLFPVKGFYEWTQDKRKTPHFIHRSDGDAMLLAGLVGTRAWKGEQLRCASILTCAPNAEMERVHDRMPVVVEADEAESWLMDADPWDLAVPAVDGTLAMHVVGPDVGNTKNDRPELMDAVGGLGAFS